jgi:hypothetical protein
MQDNFWNAFLRPFLTTALGSLVAALIVYRLTKPKETPETVSAKRTLYKL